MLNFIFLDVAATSDSSDPYITEVSMVLKVYHALNFKGCLWEEKNKNKNKQIQTNRKTGMFFPILLMGERQKAFSVVPRIS